MASVYVASGHSAPDPGAVGNGLIERDVNASVCRRVVKRLRDHGIKVFTDLDKGNLRAADEIKESHRYRSVALFYSQHHNAGPSTARGYEVYGARGSSRAGGQSWRFARALHRAQLAALRKLDPTVPDRGTKEAKGTRGQWLVYESNGSGAMSELLFLSNRKDAAIVKRKGYTAAVAEATVRAIVEFGRAEGLWKKAYKPPAKPKPEPVDPCARIKEENERLREKNGELEDEVARLDAECDDLAEQIDAAITALT